MSANDDQEQVTVVYTHPNEPYIEDFKDFHEVFGPFRNEQTALDWIDMKTLIHGWKGKFIITTTKKP